MDRLKLPLLEFLARKQEVLPVLGFFLDLTAFLTNNATLRKAAQRLRDRRRRRMENFFVNREPNDFEKELAERNTPPVARKWHFLLNMGMDSFEEVLRKNISQLAGSRS